MGHHFGECGKGSVTTTGRASPGRIRLTTFAWQASIENCPDTGPRTYYSVESNDDESSVIADHLRRIRLIEHESMNRGRPGLRFVTIF